MKVDSFKYLLASIGLVVLWMFVLYLPLKRNHTDAVLRAQEAASKLEEFEKTILHLEEYLVSLKVLSDDRKELDETLYAKKDVLKLLQHLNETASGFSLKLIEITPPIEELLELNRTVADTTRPLFLNIGLQMSGRYKDFGRFVRSTESSSYYQGTNLCQITGGKDRQEKLLFDFSFTALLGNVEDKP